MGEVMCRHVAMRDAVSSVCRVVRLWGLNSLNLGLGKQISLRRYNHEMTWRVSNEDAKGPV